MNHPSLLVIVLLSVLPLSTAWAQDIELWSGAEEPFDDGQPGALDSSPWWESYDDPLLTELIEEAIAANHDVDAALARLDAAEERIVQTRAPMLPMLSAEASLSAQPSESLTFRMGGMPTGGGTTMPEVIGSGSALLSLNYQFDLWGMQMEALRASQASATASADDLDAMAFSVAGQVGESYFDVLAAQQQIAVVNRQIETQSSLLELLESRYRQGDGQASDVLQQRQQVASARANLTSAQTTLRVALQRLALVLGRSSTSELRTMISDSATLPEPPPLPPTGRPADLLESRPDLRASSARLESSRHQLRSSRRAFLPTLGISGSAGGELFISDEADAQTTWNVGMNLSLPLFNGLSNVASTREAEANIREASASLEGALLQASTEVEGALDLERESEETLEAHRDMLVAAQEAFESAQRSYVGGVGSYLSVMTALSSLQQAELLVLQSERNVLSARGDLYQSLGGSWTRGLATRGTGGRR
jgi:NodT family efflux transporter outer membrane factor (OMF) lipoprotein